MRLRHIVLLMSLVGITSAQEATKTPTMTREEKIVRNAYTNLTAAAQVGVLWHAIELPDSQAKVDHLSVSEAMDRQLHFDLTDFKVGELRQVGKASSSSLVTGPVGSLIAQYHEIPVGNVLEENDGRFNLVYADVTFKSASEFQDSSGRPVPIQKVSTVKQFVRALRQPDKGGDWTRYASYSVVAKIGERSISYRATFLFSGRDTTEEILPLDYATAMNIAPFIKLQVCPAAVATTVFKGAADAGAWVRQHNACRCSKAHDEGNSSDRDSRYPRSGAPYAVRGNANRD